MDKQTILINQSTASDDGQRLWSVITEFLKVCDKGVKVTVERYSRIRTIEQNKLQRKWLKEAEDQGDMTAEEYRGYCKLHFGIAIAKENDEFAEKYDRLIKPFTYEQKLELMMVPIDMPVTRIMNAEQNARYLNKMYTHFIGLGFKLTVPENSRDLYFDALMRDE